MNLVFIGSAGPFSQIPLQFLLGTGHKICAVLCEQSHADPRFPIINDSVESLAHQNSIPCLSLNDDIVQILHSMHIDLIIVACYGKKIADKIITIAKWGCVNLHPSLLPEFRGPIPVFWQMKAKPQNPICKLGVSLHIMTDKIDSGAIIKQSSILIDDGLSQTQIMAQLAQQGITLIQYLLDNIECGINNAQAQNEQLASSMSYPQQEDFFLSNNCPAPNCSALNWSAPRLYNFICASQHFGQVYSYRQLNKTYQFHSALSYTLSTDDSEVLVENDKQQLISCHDGSVLVHLV